MSYNEETMSVSVIQTGGKQYKVSQGDVIKIEKVKGDFKVGDILSFENVLLVSDNDKVEIGTPIIQGASVKAKILEIGKDKKVEVVKYKAKSRYYKRNGHRQPIMKVEII